VVDSLSPRRALFLELRCAVDALTYRARGADVASVLRDIERGVVDVGALFDDSGAPMYLRVRGYMGVRWSIHADFVTIAKSSTRIERRDENATGYVGDLLGFLQRRRAPPASPLLAVVVDGLERAAC
jgi:hypothetical protein